MNTYVIHCECGNMMSVESESRDEAIDRMKIIMSKRGIADHYNTFHGRTEKVPTVAEIHTQIEEEIKEAIFA